MKQDRRLKGHNGDALASPSVRAVLLSGAGWETAAGYLSDSSSWAVERVSRIHDAVHKPCEHGPVGLRGIGTLESCDTVVPRSYGELTPHRDRLGTRF